MTGTVVRWESVRDRLLELYGTAVDHPELFQAFRLVMDAGGYQSPHMEDLHAYTTVYVNPKIRKMRFEAYAVVAPYPTCFPRVKNACLKWAWRQPTSRNWCPLPPNIMYRVGKDSKHQMIDVIIEIERAMRLSLIHI